MITSKMKESIAKFMKADLSQVKDTELRAKGEKLQSKQGGFTLLELLVVVAILAIIAGSVIASLDGKEEGAAQATAVHTMATLENGMRVFETTEKRLLPDQLETLLCVDGFDHTQTDGSLPLDPTAITTATVLGGPGNSNVARVNGGLTADLAGGLVIANLLADASTGGAYSALINAGLTNPRYVSAQTCDQTDGETLTLNGSDAVPDLALVDVTKPNLLFRDPLTEDDEWEYGAGAAADLTALAVTDTLPIAFLAEPAEIGADEDDIVAVFGVGPDSSMINEIIGRAPSDGNVGPDKYGHFSIAVKVAECAGGIEATAPTVCTNPANWTVEKDEVGIVAVLDGGGDAYDDEIAEAKGNEEE